MAEAVINATEAATLKNKLIGLFIEPPSHFRFQSSGLLVERVLIYILP
jgi:hypothetical protein